MDRRTEAADEPADERADERAVEPADDELTGLRRARFGELPPRALPDEHVALVDSDAGQLRDVPNYDPNDGTRGYA